MPHGTPQKRILEFYRSRRANQSRSALADQVISSAKPKLDSIGRKKWQP
jgi:hypothetical protein